MADTTTIRISSQAHEKLKEFARESGEALTTILDQAVEAYRRQKFLEDANAAYAKLRSDPVAWAEELEERKLWEATLMDGLEDDN